DAGDRLPRSRRARDGRGPTGGRGPDPRRDHRGLGERSRLEERLERLGVRSELEALVTDPRVAVVRAGVAVAAVADQRDDAALLVTRAHLRRKHERSPDI